MFGRVRDFLREVLLSQIHWLPRYYALFTRRNLLKNKLVLDLGCGEGIAAIRLARCCQVIGLDRQLPDIRKAARRQQPGRLCRRAEFLVGDMTQLPFADAAFDSVICLDALQMVEHDTAALAEMARVLKPAGTLMLSVAVDYACSARLFHAQRILRRMIPRVLWRPYRPGAPHWLSLDAVELQKYLHVARFYSLEKITMRVAPFFVLSRATYILKKFGALATDITYGINGMWSLRFLFFWCAVRMDACFFKETPGYSLFIECIKK